MVVAEGEGLSLGFAKICRISWVLLPVCRGVNFIVLMAFLRVRMCECVVLLFLLFPR